MKRHILGFSLILAALIPWGLIIDIPLPEVGIKTIWYALAILFITSTIFWVGAFLVVKEFTHK